MYNRAGEWFIGDFEIPFPIDAEYNKYEIKINCLAIGKEFEDPRTEIEEVKQYLVMGYSNDPVLSEGSILYTLDPHELIDITDGYHSFQGAVVGVDFEEDSRADKYIFYTITLAIWRERQTEFPLGFSRTYDEIKPDPNWENAWQRPGENFADVGFIRRPAQHEICPHDLNITGVGSAGAGLPTWTIRSSITYTNGYDYHNLTKYSRTPIHGAVKTELGYKITGPNEKRLEGRLGNAIYHIALPRTINRAKVTIFGNFAPNTIEGRYGEEVITRAEESTSKYFYLNDRVVIVRSDFVRNRDFRSNRTIACLDLVPTNEIIFYATHDPTNTMHLRDIIVGNK